MTPCAWFPAAAAFARQNPACDLGVHVTLNSEWDAYRWKPLSTLNPASGLIDAEGYMHRSVQAVQENASTEAVLLEIEAQVKCALQAGITPTHIDTHMGTVLHPKFLPAYLQVAIQYHLPPLAMRWDAAAWQLAGADEQTAQFAAQIINSLEEAGIPLHDGLFYLDLSKPDNRFEQAQRMIENLPLGLSRLYIHPCYDTPEARAISPDWRSRVMDYQIFVGEEMRSCIQKTGVHLIHYQDLKHLMSE